MKRIVSVFICIILLLNSVPAVFAVSTEDIRYEMPDDQTIAIELFNKIGDFEYSLDGEYETLTRQEFVHILMTLLGKTDYMDESYYYDVTVDNPYFSEINTATSYGYVNGTDPNFFSPEDKITEAQIAKILLNVLGYKPMAQIDGGDIAAYLKIAFKLDIVDSISSESSEVTVQKGLTLIYRAFIADTFEVRGVRNDDVSYENGQSILYEMLDVKHIKGKLNANEITALTGYKRTSEGTIQVGNVFIDSSENLSEQLGMNILCFYKESQDGYREYLWSCPIQDRVININISDIATSASDLNSRQIKYYQGNRVRTVTFSSTPEVFLNGVNPGVSIGFEYIDFEVGNIKLIDNNDDGVYEIIKVFEYEYICSATQLYETSKVITDAYNPSRILYLDTTDTDVFYTVYKGEEKGKLEDISVKDIVAFAESDVIDGIKCVTIRISGKTITGTMLSKAEDKMTINGEDYKYRKNVLTVIPSPGSYGIFRLDFENMVVAYEPAESDDLFYGFVCEIAPLESTFDDRFGIRMYTEGGTFVNYECSEKMLLNSSRCKTYAALENELWKSPFQEGNIGQIVKYSLDDEGKINRIYTTESDYENAPVKGEYKARLFSRRGLTGMGRTLYDYVVADTTIFMTVGPYNIITNTYDENNFYICDYQTLYQSSEYMSQPYDVDSDMTSPFVLLTCTQPSLASNTYPYLVKDIFKTLDDNGDIVTKILALKENTEYELLAKENDETLFEGIERGDFIRLLRDWHGEVAVAPSVMVKQNNLKQGMYGSRFDYALKMLVARPLRLVNTRIVVTFTEAEPVGGVKQGDIDVIELGSAYITLFDVDTGNTEKLNVSELMNYADQDIVILLLDGYIKEVYVFV